MNWTTSPPTEVGWYWFYGDPFMGTMGCEFAHDFHGPDERDLQVVLVRVWQASNGLIAVTGGQFMSLNTFTKSQAREGHLGYWAKAELPEPPAWDLWC